MTFCLFFFVCLFFVYLSQIKVSRQYCELVVKPNPNIHQVFAVMFLTSYKVWSLQILVKVEQGINSITVKADPGPGLNTP